MEKKLTDEKAMFNYIANTILGEVKPLYLRKRIVNEIFDLIHRLQEENELKTAQVGLLTEQVEFLKNCGDNFLADYEKAQKQVDKQKAEIEQLTKEKGKYQEKWQTSYMNELNLQKQVDELKSENTELYKEHTTLIAGSILEKQNTVKDTAREILQEVDDESNGQTISVTNVLRKRYGVEVE